jgi:hypothetical protein
MISAILLIVCAMLILDLKKYLRKKFNVQRIRRETSIFTHINGGLEAENEFTQLSKSLYSNASSTDSGIML